MPHEIDGPPDSPREDNPDRCPSCARNLRRKPHASWCEVRAQDDDGPDTLEEARGER